MFKIPQGLDACSWDEADAVLCPNGNCYSIETKTHQGALDSFVIFFEPGESEIGIHQAEHCLGMLPVRKNSLFELNDTSIGDEHVKVDYTYIRDRTAADVRRVATFLIERASEIGQGDLAVFEQLMYEEFQQWWELMLVRYAFLQENKGLTLNLNEQVHLTCQEEK